MSVTATDALQISRRYATAIFSLALEAKKEDAVVGEMLVIADAISANKNLRETLANPIVTNAQKAAVLAGLIGKADAITKKAVATISDAGRASVIPMIAADLKARLAAHQGEAEAIITSAHALPAATQNNS